MKVKEDFPLEDEKKDYCVHCARADGTMQSYQEKLESMTGFIVKTQGLDPGAARKAAEGMMARLPAWKSN